MPKPRLPSRAAIERTGFLVALGGALLGAVLLIWLALGGYDVSASQPHDAASYVAIHAVMIRSVETRSARIHSPPRYTVAQTIAGFRRYDADCAGCHGGPGVARAAWADRMTPVPPFLIDARRDWSDAELFWIVCHGVKMTAMPGWGGAGYSDADVWDAVAFLNALPYVSARDYQALRRAYAGPAAQPAERPRSADCLSQP